MNTKYQYVKIIVWGVGLWRDTHSRYMRKIMIPDAVHCTVTIFNFTHHCLFHYATVNFNQKVYEFLICGVI